MTPERKIAAPLLETSWLAEQLGNPDLRILDCSVTMEVTEFIRPHKNVIDYELLPYHRFGLGKYMSLGVTYELEDYKTPSDDVVKHLQSIIDEAFGRSGEKALGER